MKIEIHSFESIQKRAQTPFEPRTNFISIGDPDAPVPELIYKPDHILRIVFDDITPEEAIERLKLPDWAGESMQKLSEILKQYHTFIFDEEMAGKIAEFVIKHCEETDVLICQCEYGQSRSAGCAAAIAEHFHGNGIEIFADDRYFPNKYVYQMMQQAFIIAGSK